MKKNVKQEKTHPFQGWLSTIISVISIIAVIIALMYIIYWSISVFLGVSFTYNILSWETITALSTFIAACGAYKAYENSVRMREQASFDAVFAQMLANFRSYLTDYRITTTVLINEQAIEVNRELSTFLNFCRYYKLRANGNLQSLEAIRDMSSFFSDQLVYKANFYNTFKYIYHLVECILNSPLDDKIRVRYIAMVQAQLNLDVLFCYLINLICASNGKATPYIESLNKYDFFEDLFLDTVHYGNVIDKTIPEHIKDQYYCTGEK